MAIYLVTKCPNCYQQIRFKLAGSYGLGWSLRTFYCKKCKETHTIQMHFATEKVESKAANFLDLTQSLWRTGGTRVLRKAHDHLPMGLNISNPAKLLGYPSHKIAKWIQAYANVFIQHLESTGKEKTLHLLELEGLGEIISKLHYIKSLASYFINKGD